MLPDRTPKRRMLVIVNPYATTVSDRLRNLVVYALQGRYAVEAVDTQRRGHAIQICREAASEGYDVVVAFGGDGTVNEAANGLVGSRTPLTACRAGRPTCRPDARHPGRRGGRHRAPAADGRRVRAAAVDTGRVNGRHFVFASGVGLDARVVERVDTHPRLKARFGAGTTPCAVGHFTRRYLVNPPRVRVDGRRPRPEGVTVIVQNSDPFTYFRQAPDPRGARRPALDSGTLVARRC